MSKKSIFAMGLLFPFPLLNAMETTQKPPSRHHLIQALTHLQALSLLPDQPPQEPRATTPPPSHLGEWASSMSSLEPIFESEEPALYTPRRRGRYATVRRSTSASVLTALLESQKAHKRNASVSSHDSGDTGVSDISKTTMSEGATSPTPVSPYDRDEGEITQTRGLDLTLPQ